MSKQYAVWYALLAVIALLAALVPPGLSGKLTTLQLLVAVGVALVFPPLLIWVGQKMGYPIGRSVHCSKCQTEMPLFRKPASVRQGLIGGYDCPNCGANLDARGRELTPGTSR